MNIPIREGVLNGIKPPCNAGFTAIDFLPSTNQTNHDGPIVMAVQIRDQKLRLRLVKVRAILFPSHKAAGHGIVPSPLSLIENHNSITGWSLISKCFITEVVHVLYEGFNFLAYFTLSDVFLNSLQSLDFITGQRFSQYGNKWTITRKKDSMGLLVIIPLFGGHIEADQCFSCTGNACHKNDMLFLITGRLLDQLLNTLGGDGEISSASIVPGNGFHRMP